MRKIALSYRRADSAAMAGRIFDDLSRHYGADDVFMDIDAIPLGMDFSEEIDGALGSAKVLLVIIGRSWLGHRDDGKTRIMDPTDPVRIEIESAMRLRLPMIPVLVDGAEMPSPGDLPTEIERFSYRNACRVDSGIDYQAHMTRLRKALDRFVAEPEPQPVAQPQPPPVAQPQPQPVMQPRPYVAPRIAIAPPGVAAMVPPHVAHHAWGHVSQAPGIAVPEPELGKWSWGPFLLWWLWPWWNADSTVKIITGALIVSLFVPVLNVFASFGMLGFAIYLGINGNRLMATNRPLQSYEQFAAVRTAWAKAGVIVLIAGVVLFFIAAIIVGLAESTRSGS